MQEMEKQLSDAEREHRSNTYWITVGDDRRRFLKVDRIDKQWARSGGLGRVQEGMQSAGRAASAAPLALAPSPAAAAAAAESEEQQEQQEQQEQELQEQQEQQEQEQHEREQHEQEQHEREQHERHALHVQEQQHEQQLGQEMGQRDLARPMARQAMPPLLREQPLPLAQPQPEMEPALGTHRTVAPLFEPIRPAAVQLGLAEAAKWSIFQHPKQDLSPLEAVQREVAALKAELGS